MIAIEKAVELFGCSTEQAQKVSAIIEDCKAKFKDQKFSKVRSWLPKDGRPAISKIAQVLNRETDFLLAHWKGELLIDSFMEYVANIADVPVAEIQEMAEEAAAPNGFYFVVNPADSPTLGWDSISGDFKVLHLGEWFKLSAEERIESLFAEDLYYEFCEVFERTFSHLYFCDGTDSYGLFLECCQISGEQLVIDEEGFVDPNFENVVSAFRQDHINRFNVRTEAVPGTRDRRSYCQELKAEELDSWREYSLVQIQDVDVEPVCLLKMICPSTGHVHVLRVPPDVRSAREAAGWVNWGVDPQDFSVET